LELPVARHESDRDDLLREATALVQRVELKIPDCQQPIVAGFRRGGAVSVFFGGDPVYQFNTAGELRRAYVGGVLYKAQERRLVALRRERSRAEVALIRAEPSAAETTALMTGLHTRLNSLRTALARDTFTVVGQVPAEADLPRRLRDWLESLPDPIRVALRPNVQ
jgi:hypothetical protein